MRSTMISIVTFLVIVALQGTAFGQMILGPKSTKAEFNEYCEVMVGHWRCNVTLRQDLPGIGKEGDELKVRAANTLSADGNALIGKGKAGKDAGVASFAYYDVTDEQTRRVSVFSGGTVAHEAISKQGDGTWVQVSIFVTPDGETARQKATLEITENGNTHTWTADGVPNVWQRVRK